MPDWVEVWGRRMFVVDFTPGGFPIGIFEDEIDREWTDELQPSAGDGSGDDERVQGGRQDAPESPLPWR